MCSSNFPAADQDVLSALSKAHSARKTATQQLSEREICHPVKHSGETMWVVAKLEAPLQVVVTL